MHSTWPSGNAMARRIESPECNCGHYLFFSSSSFLLFSFPFSYCSFVSLYSFNFFIFINFLPYCLFSLSTSCRFPEVLISRGLAIHAFLVNLVLKKRNELLKV